MTRLAGLLAFVLLLPTMASAQPPKPACVVDQAVEILWQGDWYPGRVLEGPRPDGTCYITYDGYASGWDEWVTADRLRRIGGVPQPSPLCSPGSAVEIEWSGSWYPGRVLDGPQTDGSCYITYDGYSSSWDEWVAPARLRPLQ